MPTQNVNLTPELEKFVRAQVASGRFTSASEVHRAALAAMAREEEERTLRLARLRGEIALGLDDLESGRHAEIADAGALESVISAAGVRALHRHREESGSRS